MNTSKYFVYQDPADRALEAKHKVYIRTCKVIERATYHVVMENLHYLDAWRLARHLNDGGTAEDFTPDMTDAGHPNAAHLLAAVGRW